MKLYCVLSWVLDYKLNYTSKPENNTVTDCTALIGCRYISLFLVQIIVKFWAFRCMHLCFFKVRASYYHQRSRQYRFRSSVSPITELS